METLKSDLEFHVTFDSDPPKPFHEVLDEFQIELITTALIRKQGVVTHAAALLNMNRTTLVERMRSLGIQWEKTTGDVVVKGQVIA